MDSIQGLSNWCIEKKKYHSLIVRYWVKWLRKSEAPHRLNLFYVANDVIQNCKRKNAIVYRTAFAEVLPDAFLLINNFGDTKVVKAVDRILTIWEQRNVYTNALIAELKGCLVKEESPPETPGEPKAPLESSMALRSKIVAEFVPQAFMEQLTKHQCSMEETELKEKQLAAMRVDVCSTDALKKLKDKAGGKKFCKDFEDGSAKLQEFVSFLDQQSKAGPLLLEALGNADIFYEMQYKEVKIVANAYQTFANRVSHLKRKLDSLKANVPDLDESPIPSPSADAPSPTGSESPFRALEEAEPDTDLDGLAMEDEQDIVLGEAPSPLSTPSASPKNSFSVGDTDNRDVEDMELSDEEAEGGSIIVQQTECPAPEIVSNPLPTVTQESAISEALPVQQATPPLATLPGNLTNVDMGKISSLLSSFTTVMKNTGGSTGSPSSAATTATSSNPTPPTPLTSLLSQVDLTSEDLLSALSKAQGQGSTQQGLPSLLNSPSGHDPSNSSTTAQLPPPTPSALPTSSAPPGGLPLSSAITPVPSPPIPTCGQVSTAQTVPLSQVPQRATNTEPETGPLPFTSSLESKIHSFLQGNPGFNAFDLGLHGDAVRGVDDLSPLTGTENQEGTPVRDEGGGTPTQDEIMDKPAAEAATQAAGGTLLSLAYGNNAWQDPNSPHHGHQQAAAPNGQGYQQSQFGGLDGVMQNMAHYQRISAQGTTTALTEGATGNATTSEFGGFQGWYGNTYPPMGAPHPNVVGGGDNPYQYQGDRAQDHQVMGSQQGSTSSGYLAGSVPSTLPPIPQLPPPPRGFEIQSVASASGMVHQEQQRMVEPMVEGLQEASLPGVVVHDHQHKSMFHHDDPVYHRGDLHRPHPDELHPYHEDPRPYYDDPHRLPEDLYPPEDPRRLHHPDDRYHHPDDVRRHPFDDPYYRPGSPPPHPYPRVQGRLTPPLSPSEDPYYYDYYPRSPSPPLYGHRPMPPHPELPHRHLGPRPLRHPRPPHHPPHPSYRYPHPRAPLRGAPRNPFHDPGKRPVLRGGGHPRGPFFPPKRPYLPPRY